MINFGEDTDFWDPEFDYIFHFAAITKAGDWCLSHQGEQWLDNQRLNTNILQFWKEWCPKAKFIAIGTSCSYGDQPYKQEKNYLSYLPESSLLTYAYTKRMLYIGLDALHKQYDMDYLYFIPSTLYGTDFTENDNHFIYDIIRKVSKAKETGSDVEMWGHGSQGRELIWVEDFIKIMYSFVFENDIRYWNLPYNVGSGKEFTMRAYYEKICKLFEYDESKIKINQMKYVGMLSNRLTITDRRIEDFKFKPINEGLEQLVNYYKTIK